jgi:ribonuclease HI
VPGRGETQQLPQVELYTDGACSGNPGPGGWAFILRHLPSGREIECWGGDARTTNNRMELMAVIEGLRRLRRRCRVDLYSDSQYVVNGLTEWMDGWKAKGWRRGRTPVKNLELWQELDDLREKHDLRAQWVRGHDRHTENERVDRLAVKAIEEFRP